MTSPYHKQHKFNTCGPACFRMVLKTLGTKKSERELVKILKTNIFQGTLHKNLVKAAHLFNLQHVSLSNATIENLRDYQKKGFVIIVSYRPPKDYYHYAVLKSIGDRYIHLYDPWYGPKTKYEIKDFVKRWKSSPLFEKKKRWFIGLKK